MTNSQKVVPETLHASKIYKYIVSLKIWFQLKPKVLHFGINLISSINYYGKYVK